MKFQCVIATAGLMMLTNCAWHDDYRQRQPNTLDKETVKTSNVASEDYVNLETNENLRNPPPASIPSIDGLSKIPEINDMR